MHLPGCPENGRKVSSTHFSTRISPQIAEILGEEHDDDPIDVSKDTTTCIAEFVKETEGRRTPDSRDYCDGKIQALEICWKTVEHYGEADDALLVLAGLFEDALQRSAAFPSLSPEGHRLSAISDLDR
jgi:hypothetical protein